MKFLQHIIKRHATTAMCIVFFVVVATNIKIIASDSPGSDGFYAGETLNPSCTPGSANCSVSSVWTASGTDNYYTAGNVGIGITNPSVQLHISDGNVPAASLITSEQFLISSNTQVDTSILVSSDTAGNRAVYKGARSRGTLASPTVPIAGDDVLTFLGTIYDGVETQGSAGVFFKVDGTVSAGVAPQRISFVTSETTGVARTEKMTIKADGKVGIGTNTPTNSLSVQPTQYSTGTASQSGTTITGIGTTFTSDMVGLQFIFSNGVNAGLITAFNSTTSLTVSISQTVTDRAYKITYHGLQVDSSGNVGIGTLTPTKLLDVNGTSIFRGASTFQQVSPELITTASQGYIVSSYDSTASGGGGQNVFRRANGTEATPTAVQSGMSLGSLSFRGYNGVAFTGSKGYISSTATENWTDTANGTNLFFMTTPNGSTTALDRMFIANDGNIGIGTATPISILHTVAVTETDMASRILNDTYSTAQLSGMIGRRARGTVASPTAVQSGDYLVAIAGRGYGDTGFGSTSTGSFNLQATENFTDSAKGTKATIRTTDNGSTTQSDKVTVLGNGNVGIGTISPQRTLHISDTMRLEPRASAPSSPASGDMYMDSSSTPNELCVYDGSAWQGISSDTDANCS